MLNRSRWAAGALLLNLCVPSFAAQITYINDRAGWTAATNLTSTITFNTANGSYTPPAAGGTSLVNSLTIESILIQNLLGATVQFFSINDSAFQTPYNNWGSGVVLRGTDSNATQGSTFKITLPGGITSFGIDLMLGAPANFTVKVNGTTLGSTVPTFTSPSRAFFGVTSDTALSTIEFVSPLNNSPFLDNLSYGVVATAQPPVQGAETPEASTLLLCASALLVLARYRRRSSTFA